MVRSVVAENTKRIIRERGYKQKAVAERIGYKEQVFSNLLNGRRVITDCDILAISNGLDVSPNELFKDPTEEMNQATA